MSTFWYRCIRNGLERQSKGQVELITVRIYHTCGMQNAKDLLLLATTSQAQVGPVDVHRLVVYSVVLAQHGTKLSTVCLEWAQVTGWWRCEAVQRPRSEDDHEATEGVERPAGQGD